MEKGPLAEEDLERAVQSHLCNIRVALGRVSGRLDVKAEIERGLRAVVEAPAVQAALTLQKATRRTG